MALAIDVMLEHDPSNVLHHHLQPNKSKIYDSKGILSAVKLRNKRKRFSFKCENVVRVAKCLKTTWLIVLW